MSISFSSILIVILIFHHFFPATSMSSRHNLNNFIAIVLLDFDFIRIFFFFAHSKIDV